MWDNIDKTSATDKQIAYAEKLLEELYGEITEPIYKMDKHQLSVLIDELIEDVAVKRHEDKKR